MPESRVHVRIEASVTAFERAAWNACFVGDLEDYDHFIAVDQAGLPGFEWFYVAAFDGAQMLAAVPGFITRYELDTTLQGWLKKPIAAMKQWFPNCLGLSLACIGSPVAECGRVGFHSDVDPQARADLLRQLLRAFEAMAARRGIGLTGGKDVPHDQAALWNASARPLGYRSVDGLPTGVLDLAGLSFDDYLAGLSKATRKSLRRKLKAASAITVRALGQLDGAAEDALMAFYHETKSRSDWQFEELTRDYFTGMLQHMPSRALCFEYALDGRPIAFNLVFVNEHRMIDKFFCMNAEMGKQYSLYFVSWLHNVRYCIEHGLRVYQSGQAGYETKLRLGSTLLRNRLYFKHANFFVRMLLRAFSPLLAVQVAQMQMESADA